MAIKKTKKVFRLLILFIVSFIASSFCYYFINIYKINQSYYNMYNIKSDIGLRKFPYPYQAALCIASDIDNTSSFEEFYKIQEFLNTKNMTEMGEGVGLEIGNSIFMYEPDWNKGLSYFSNKYDYKLIIRKFIKMGYIDCLHSFGDGYEDREQAIIALKDLKNNNVHIRVWINHQTSKSNFGEWYVSNLGDKIKTKYYHADLTIPYGIKYVWLGSSTYIIGQSTKITFNTIIRSCDSKYPIKSLYNIGKEIIKHLLSIFKLSKSKYQMHGSNELVRITTLSDGQKIYEFMRFDNYPNGIGYGATSKTMAYNLSDRVISQLKEVYGFAILYTHFGRNEGCTQVICEETKKALRSLEKEYRNGKVYVTTTSKLLNYYINHKYLNWTHRTINNEVIININSIDDPIFGSFVPNEVDLQGITFYIPTGKIAKIFIKKREISNILKNPKDENNRESVTIPLQFLEPLLEPPQISNYMK